MVSRSENKGSVIVTGGTYGLGRGITLLLAERGWSVVAFGLESPQVSSEAQNAIPALREEASQKGLDVTLLEADVSSEKDVASVVEATLKAHGRIDALVNNAAIGPLGTVMETDPELWDRIMAVNLKGPYLACRAVIPHMVKNGGGAIVNVGSGAGWGKSNMAAYASSKGGILTLSAALALDHFQDHIRVNTVVPGGGGIDAGMSRGRAGHAFETLQANAPGSVAGRVITGEDLAKAVAFLISPDAETISGTIIDVGCFAHQGGPVPPKHTHKG